MENHPIYMILIVWRERNCVASKEGTIAVQRLKYSFAHKIWSWNILYLGEEALLVSPIYCVSFWFFE